MTTTTQTGIPFTVFSGDTKAGPLKLGNRSPSRLALLGFYAELEHLVQVRLAQAKAQPLPEAEPQEPKGT